MNKAEYEQPINDNQKRLFIAQFTRLRPLMDLVPREESDAMLTGLTDSKGFLLLEALFARNNTFYHLRMLDDSTPRNFCFWSGEYFKRDDLQELNGVPTLVTQSLNVYSFENQLGSTYQQYAYRRDPEERDFFRLLSDQDATSSFLFAQLIHQRISYREFLARMAAMGEQEEELRKLTGSAPSKIFTQERFNKIMPLLRQLNEEHLVPDEEE